MDANEAAAEIYTNWPFQAADAREQLIPIVQRAIDDGRKDLLALCKMFLRIWEHSGPNGTAQWEKFDTVVLAAEAAVTKEKFQNEATLGLKHPENTV